MSWFSSALGMDKNDAGDAFRIQQENLLRQVQGYTPIFDSIARGNAGTYSQFEPQYVDDLQNEADLLGRSTSEQQRTAYLNRATGNVANNYARGINNATASLAARGLGDSGTAAGVVGNAEVARAGAVSNAANNADQYFDNAQIQRENMLTNLVHGGAQGALGNEENAMGHGISLDEYGAQQEGNLAQQAYNLKAQQQAAAGGALSGLIGTAASIYGMSHSPGGSTGSQPQQGSGTYDAHPYYSPEYGYTGDQAQDSMKDIYEGN